MNKRLHVPQNPPHLFDSPQHGQLERKVEVGLIPSSLSYFDQYLGRSGELHVYLRWLDDRTIGSNKVVRHITADYCFVLGKCPSKKIGWEKHTRLGQIQCN